MSGKKGVGRLPSFKGKRDLTLSCSTVKPSSKRSSTGIPVTLAASLGRGTSDTKKKFVPNLNVARKSKVPATGTEDDNQNRQSKSHWKKTDERKERDRGKSGFKQRPELIQTMNVFSEGIGSEGIRRKGSWGSGSAAGDGESKAGLEKPKLNLNFKVDKNEEAARLKELLRDDFGDDLSSGPLVPVQLPMVDTGTLFKKELLQEDIEVKGTTKKKKNLILDSDDDDEDSKDSMAELDGKPCSSKATAAAAGKHERKPTGGDQLTFQDFVKTQKGELFFMQLPDHLPGVTKKPESNHNAESAAEGQQQQQQSVENEMQNKCVLRDLPEGYAGKIQIRKSGKAQLLIGDILMDMDLGTQVGFLQDLASISTPPTDSEDQQQNAADLTVLGHVRHRVVLTPDWTKLFKADAESLSSSSDGDNEAG